MAASRRNQTFDVFVGNLPSDANEKNVGKLFTPYGEIGGIIVKESTKAKGPNKWFAFVKFLCEPDAEKACVELDKMNLNGIEITVKRADKDRKRNQFDTKKIPRTPDSESADSVGGLAQSAEPYMYEAEINGVAKTLELLRANMRETVMITHVENPITLWIQVVNDDNTKKIFSITEQLATLCPAAVVVSGSPEPGKTYGSLYAEDNMWYRCQVKQTLGTDKYKIQYIDYGNTEEVNVSSLVEIPTNVANMKGLANKLVLHNIRTKDLSDKQGIQFLRSMTDNQMASLDKTRPLADGSGFYGQLYINDQSVGDAMTQAGFCQSRPGLGKVSGQNKQQQNEGTFESQGQQLMGQNMYGGDKNNMHRDRSTTSPSPNVGFHQMSSIQPDLGREQELQNELSKKRRELDKARCDKDTATIKVEYMKSKVKTLQEEFAASAAKLKEDTMSKRINTLVSLAKVVRHLRNQFPTNEKPCLLEEAIEVCTSKDRVDNSKCTTLQGVGSALAQYKAAQDEISKCKQQSELDEIVTSRDETRKQLHRSLTACLEELALLPLDERSKLVQDLQMRLTNVYGEYLKLQVHDCPNIENVAAGFKAWKMKKDAEFTDVRTVTNFSEEALQTALSQVKERIRIDCVTESDKPEVDIDELMKTCSHALQREISVTDLIRSKDANLVANVISSVIRELQNEAAMLENFRVLQGEFKSRQEIITPWLEEKPTFTDLQERRKSLRSLRSKLRHKMADKVDAEEGGSEGELDSIKEEEEKIRSELQAALVKCDALLHEVAALADSNFPELIVQYPDLAIDQFLVYKGLVKGNRELDHYSLSPGFKPGVHLSTFNGDPVLIQEFLLDQLSKEEFMKRVITYPGETCKPQAVFFSKNERQAYLEVGWQRMDLIEKTIQDTTPTPHKLQHICQQLTQEVVILHKHGYIHGEINTQSILLRNNEQAILMNPDFSKSVQERLNKKVTTENGLVFQCPDVQYSSVEMIGAAADIYNLVLFMFWLHCPSLKQSPFSSGSQETGIQNLDTSLQALFDGVLRGKSANRLTAEQILQIDYFRKTLPDHFDPPIPVFQAAPKTPSPPPQNTVVKSMNEPMEIGVFRAEDFPTPQMEEIQQTAVDTDDSWTTKSSSSGSRVGSPLEDGVDAAKATVNGAVCDVVPPDASVTVPETNQADLCERVSPINVEKGTTETVSSANTETVSSAHTETVSVKTEPSSNYGGNSALLSGNVPDYGEVKHQMTPAGDSVPNKVGDVFSQANVPEALGDVISQASVPDKVGDLFSEAGVSDTAGHVFSQAGVSDSLGDVFSQASNSDYLNEDRKSLGEILSGATVTGKKESNTSVEDGNNC